MTKPRAHIFSAPGDHLLVVDGDAFPSLPRPSSRDKLLPEFGMGLEFVRMSPQDRQYLKQYVHEEVTKGIVNGERKDLLEETGPRRKGAYGIIT
jgi:hypothetical protein